jgi:hypothetical protein
MPSISVDAFEWDDDNEAECGNHGLSPEIAFEVLIGMARFFLNKPRRTGTHMMIGPDNTGRCWTIPMLKTTKTNVWRPITGYPSAKSEMELYEDQLRRETRKW